MPAGTEKVHAVGRLDADTSGLLLFTNDTAFAARFSEAEAGVEKEYVARVQWSVSSATVEAFRRGVELDGKRTRPARGRVLKHEAKWTELQVVLTEGRNRQIRRMWDLLGHPVLALKRMRIGPIRLGSLPVGRIRPLSDRERRALA